MYYYYCCIVFRDLELILLSTVRKTGYMLECTTHVDLPINTVYARALSGGALV